MNTLAAPMNVVSQVSSSVTWKFILDNADKIDAAHKAVREAEQQVKENFGPTAFYPDGIFNSQFRARLISSYKGESLFKLVYATVMDSTSAQAVVDWSLLPAVVRAVLLTLEKANSAST